MPHSNSKFSFRTIVGWKSQTLNTSLKKGRDLSPSERIKMCCILKTVSVSCFLLSLVPVRCAALGMDMIDVPEAQHTYSSLTCIAKFCLKYFHSEKAVIGSLVIVNIQNATEFHSDLITILNEKTNYDISLMTKDATKKHGNTVHVVDKAKNYFVVLNKTSEALDAIEQW